MKWFSQLGQDKFIIEKIFNKKKNGFFVDIGAHDGIFLSNTKTLESELNWSGVCVEPSRMSSDLVLTRQNSKVYNYCVCPEEFQNKIVRFREKTQFEYSHTIYEDLYGNNLNPLPLEMEASVYHDRLKKCKTLNSILEESNLKQDIDYVSIDTNGFEWLIVKDFPFDKWNVRVFTIANDMYVGGEKKKNRDKTKSLMKKNGYKLTRAFSLKHLDVDNWNKDYEGDIIEELYVKQDV